MKGLSTAALALGLATSSASAAEITVQPPEAPGKAGSVLVLGQIAYGDDKVFEAKTLSLSGTYLVVLDSPGGNANAGLGIGKAIRMHGWPAAVPFSCSSACALMWLGGTTRIMAPGAQIGFHAVSIDGHENGMGNALVGRYLTLLGYGDEVVKYVTIASPDDILLLSPERAREIGIDVVVKDFLPPLPTTQTAPASPAPPTAPAAFNVPATPMPPSPCAATPGGGPDLWRREASACGYRSIRTFDRQIVSNGRYVRREMMIDPGGAFRMIVTEFDAVSSQGGSVCDFLRSGWSDCVNMTGAHFQLKPESVAWFLRIADGEDPDAIGPIAQPPAAVIADGPEKWRSTAIANGYRSIRTWTERVRSTGRYIHRELMIEPQGTYRLIATDRDDLGGSNGGSICDFTVTGYSDCVGSAGNHYQLKSKSITWFLRVAAGDSPGT